MLSFVKKLTRKCTIILRNKTRVFIVDLAIYKKTYISLLHEVRHKIVQRKTILSGYTEFFSSPKIQTYF
jgi:hypothetical protein